MVWTRNGWEDFSRSKKTSTRDTLWRDGVADDPTFAGRLLGLARSGVLTPTAVRPMTVSQSLVQTIPLRVTPQMTGYDSTTPNIDAST